ncbi:glycosyltransferase family 2 protein [Anditalea andensis]|uniref:Glycosyl hydrolase n=1 Tax=Anditalea andensis TaxID=1048983 RepID=A0A074L2M6_9BACT|nr:glycosyltransferase family 2 protein [Anditalea andensis]KEO74093.1 glycosyl hydrolase [Anditalea andensis]
MKNPIIDILMPAYNEQNSVQQVIMEIPDVVRHILVVNNNSNDDTKTYAQQAGAMVIDEPQRGYGKACLSGIAHIATFNTAPDILVFLDADYSDYPAQLKDLIRPIIEDDYDLVIGSRAKGKRESGSMTLPQLFGNWLSTTLMKWIYKTNYSDLGPFRAIKWDRLQQLCMEDETFGWTIEMQIKAAKLGFKTTEVPVDYRQRIGISKISGTVKGVFGAGYKILWTIWRYR